MTEQTQRLKKALDGCAERGISPTNEPWQKIEGRLEARATATVRRPRRFVPRTKAGLAFAAVLVALFGMGAFAASGPVHEQFRGLLPGAEGPVYGEQLGISQTANGVKVSLEWAYADQRNVVVGYNIKDLEGNRQVAGRPAELGFVGVEDEAEAGERRTDERFPNRVQLTDEGGTDFDGAGGQSANSGNLRPLEDVPAAGVFTPEKVIDAGERRFRLTIPVMAQQLPSMSPSEPVGEPFVFDFEIPVRPAQVIEPNQTVEVDGVSLTLERVANSPARPEAKFCYDSPDTRYDWQSYGEMLPDGYPSFAGGPSLGEDRACTTMLLPASLEGRSEVTVESLEGIPDCPPGDDNGCSIPPSRMKIIEGPWTFDVSAPGTGG